MTVRMGQRHAAGGPALKSKACVAAMKRRGMSQTAIRRALGLSAAQAVAAGLVDPQFDPQFDPRFEAPAAPGSSLVPGSSPTIRPPRTIPRPSRDAGRGLAMMAVLDAVAAAGKAPREDLLGAGRGHLISALRQLAMVMIRELCVGATWPAIGRFLNRDSTTVWSGRRAAARRLRCDRRYRAVRDAALRALNEDGAKSEQGDRP